MENFDYGGATTHLINLINSKKFKNTKFLIVTNKGNRAVKNILSSCKKKQIRIIYYSSLFFPIFNNKLFKLLHILIKPFLFIISIMQMNKIIKKIEFDILLANFGGYGDFRSEISGLIAAKIQKRKNLFLLVHHSYTKPLFWNNFINKFLSSILGTLVKGIVFVSNATKKNIIQKTYLVKFSKSKIKIIHNGVDIKIKSKKSISLFNEKKSIIKILMLSRIERYKGHEDLVEGFSKLPKEIQNKYKIFFVGSGKPKFIKELKNKISYLKVNKNINFLNYLNFDSIRILKSVDIFFSLTRDFEGFGYSIAESLLAETPVVSTKVGGVIEFLNKNNSELIDPKSPRKISQILIRFIKSRKHYKRKAINGKLLIKKKFNSDLMGEKFFNFFEKTI